MSEYDHSGREPDNWRDDLPEETVDFLDALGNAVEGKVCSVSACQTNPITQRNGRALCAKHRDIYDNSTFGEPCERCGSKQWVVTPDAESHAWCLGCEVVIYDESITEGSW